MILNLDDFEIAARRRLPRPLFGYIAALRKPLLPMRITALFSLKCD